MLLEYPLSSSEIAAARLWQSEIAAFQNHSLPPNPVLFTGSSSIGLWNSLAEDFPDFPVINRGFGGSQLSDSVYHFERLVVPVTPRAVVLYAGDNDIAFEKPSARVAENFQAFVQLMQTHLPDTPLFFISIKPSPSRWFLRNEIRRANSTIEAICRAEELLHFVNIEPCLLDESGVPRAGFYVEDDLHLSAGGYDAWKGVLRPLLARIADANASASIIN